MISELIAQFSGLSLFDHRLFRAGAAAILGALIVFASMPRFIQILNRMDATSDFDDQRRKAPPILGGMLLVLSVLIATLIFAKMNSYVVSILVIMVAYTIIGGIDDVLKIRNKRLVATGKITKKDYQDKADGLSSSLRLALYFMFSLLVAVFAYKFIPGMDGYVTVPFVRQDVWYPYLPNWLFIALICMVTTSTANGANFTDGLDTLVSVPIITTSTFVGVVAYISGNAIFSDYLLLPYLPGVDELLPICAAIVGATLAYLWFNSPPAEIYMGDGGSIGLGGAIGMMFVLIKAPLFLPIVGVIFLAEAASSFAQIGYFKLTKRSSPDGVGRRIFLRAPLHEHYKLKWADRFHDRDAVHSKIIWRFHLVSVLALIVGSLIFFKVR